MATHFAKPEHARDYGEARALPADTLQQWGRVIVGLVPVAGVRAILDLGGGTGSWLIALLGHYSGLEGTLFDLPNAAAVARQRLDAPTPGVARTAR